MKFIVALIALLPAVLAAPTTADDGKTVVPVCGCKNAAGEYRSATLCYAGRGAFYEGTNNCYGADGHAPLADTVFNDPACELTAGPGYKAECKNITVCKRWFNNELWSYAPC